MESVCEDGIYVNGGDVTTEEKFLNLAYQLLHVCPILVPVPMVQPPNLVILYHMIWGRGSGDQKFFIGRDAKSTMSS